jgi:NADPH-dependent curcumin reductase CurA
MDLYINALFLAAAGGTGQFAVQIAKLAGNCVIGTCGSEDKVKFLKEIGCDRVINYKKEDVGTVLKKEFPQGVDLVYECVGGKMLEAALNSLAIHGKIVVIGMISGYVDQSFGAKSKGKLQSIRKLTLNYIDYKCIILKEIPLHYKIITVLVSSLISLL